MAPRTGKQSGKARGATSRSTRGRRRTAPASQPHQTIDYRTLFEHSADAILVVDGKGRYIDANPAACDLTGYTREELLLKRIGDLTIPSNRTFSAERFDVLRRTGRTRKDRVLLTKDGKQIPVEAVAVDVGNGTYQTVLRDISARVTAQAELKSSLDAYSTLVQLCHAAVIAAGPNGRISSWNPAAEALFGYTMQEALGTPITRIIPQRLRRKHLSGYRRHTGTERGETFGRILYTQGLRKDGTEVPIEVSAAVGWQGGEQVFTAVIRDISEHQAVVETLNDALQRLQFHVERMPLGYIVWDADFRVKEWNTAAERMFGYEKAEAVGRHAYDLIVPPSVIPAIDAIWADLLKGDTSSHSINVNFRKDGSELMCEWFNTPLRDSAGGIRGVASMAMDVSEREAMEAKLRDAQKLESLGVMAGGIAHDFNNSLMVILGNTALLRSAKGMSPRASEHIELIEEAGSRADKLIKHLLAYARTGRHNPQPADLNAIIEDAIKFIQSSIGRHHTVKLQLAANLPEIRADRSQVEQIILNLCLNAKEAMADGGRIQITTHKAELLASDVLHCAPYDAKPGRYVEMVVSDTGCGMDEVTVTRIFDPFFTAKPEGHGLGLAAVLGILRQHHAAAMVDSQQGRGTEFHVFFPIPHDEVEAKQSKSARKRKSSSNRKRRSTARR